MERVTYIDTGNLFIYSLTGMMFKPKNWLTNWHWQGVETLTTSSLTKQVAFIDQLLDIVMIHDAAEDPLTKSMLTPGIVRWGGRGKGGGGGGLGPEL